MNQEVRNDFKYQPLPQKNPDLSQLKPGTTTGVFSSGSTKQVEREKTEPTLKQTQTNKQNDPLIEKQGLFTRFVSAGWNSLKSVVLFPTRYFGARSTSAIGTAYRSMKNKCKNLLGADPKPLTIPIESGYQSDFKKIGILERNNAVRFSGAADYVCFGEANNLTDLGVRNNNDSDDIPEYAKFRWEKVPRLNFENIEGNIRKAPD